MNLHQHRTSADRSIEELRIKQSERPFEYARYVYNVLHLLGKKNHEIYRFVIRGLESEGVAINVEADPRITALKKLNISTNDCTAIVNLMDQVETGRRSRRSKLPVADLKSNSIESLTVIQHLVKKGVLSYVATWDQYPNHKHVELASVSNGSSKFSEALKNYWLNTVEKLSTLSSNN